MKRGEYTAVLFMLELELHLPKNDVTEQNPKLLQTFHCGSFKFHVFRVRVRAWVRRASLGPLIHI